MATAERSSSASSKTLPVRDIASFEGNGPTSPKGFTASPLSSKLNTVLATTYTDSDFRDALALLDVRGVRNTAETRRQLRLQVQKEVIASNACIVEEFGKVAEQLRRIGGTLDRLNASYGEMKGRALAARSTTSAVLDEASNLSSQRHQIDTKQLLVQGFHQHFVLGQDEVECLTSTAEPVDERFFEALTKAKRIGKDCELLLGLERQSLGLEIMDQTARHLNLAFQKLYKWVRLQFSSLNLENPQMGSSIRHALRVLAERPSLFQNCLEVFADSRQHVLSDAFYTALTGSSPSGEQDRSVKPIELVAHDPLRYVGDMLAWTHSAAVSEKESLEIFFVSEADEIAKGIKAGRETEFWRITETDGDASAPFDTVKALKELVDRDMSGVARILRQRVEQVIQVNEDSTLAYRVSNLLNFYRLTFARLLGAEAMLVESLSSIESEALRLFRSLMREHAAALQPELRQTATDLAPPDFLSEALEQLTTIMRTYETSLAPAQDREADFRDILTEALDPFLAGCESMARNVAPPADSIFRINCLSAARTRLGPFDFTNGRCEDIQGTITTERHKLVDSQYNFLRLSSGLDALMGTLDQLDQQAPEAKGQGVKTLAALQPEALTQAGQQLDDFLPSALMDALENLDGLQDATLAREITEDAAERFCGDFERVEQMLVVADENESGLRGDNGGYSDSDEVHSLRMLFLEPLEKSGSCCHDHKG